MPGAIKLIRGSVTSPKGFMADGVCCGIKKRSKKDLALIVSGIPATAAGVFTQNKLRAAPVVITEKNNVP